MRSCLSLILFLSSSLTGFATTPQILRSLGPIPVPPAIEAGTLSPDSELAPELNPGKFDELQNTDIDLGLDQPLRWEEIALDEQGCWEGKAEGIYWLSGRFDLDRWTAATFSITGADSSVAWIDGEKLNPPKKKIEMIRGRHQLLLRLKNLENSRICVSATPDPLTQIHWNPPGQMPLSSLDSTLKFTRYSSIALSRNARFLARNLIRRSPEDGKSLSEMAILNLQGHAVLPAIGTSRWTPERFAPKTGKLLISERLKAGTTLRLLDPATSKTTVLCRDEPGLSFARFSPQGRRLLIASSFGIKKEKIDKKAPRRRKALREKLSDYEYRRQIFLLDTISGARRLLLPAGDWVIDDLSFLPSGHSLVYLKTLPLEKRPWFETEIHRLDLPDGSDELLAKFRGGWEGRPSRLSPSPDGEQVAFIGPPEEIGINHQEHNVYNRALWLLSLSDGSFRRISTAEAPALSLGRSEFLSWQSRGILAGVSIGSRTGIGWFSSTDTSHGQDQPWSFEEIPLGCETIDRLSMAPDGSALAFVAEGREKLPSLKNVDLSSGKIRVLEEPNLHAESTFRPARAGDESFVGPGGQMIDSWSYAAINPGNTEQQPLIIYYYGGAVPTDRSFDPEHQLLAANGYAVLVLNPRGALGYGDAFADEHVADWGLKASADILAGLDHFLERHPEIDPDRIGIYGGSYGGFMTEYLVSHSDRFAAAVSMYGISDIASYWGAGTWGYTYGDTALAGIYPWSRPDFFSGNSPLYHADAIHTPLLLLHGLADVNVPEGESEQLYTALRSLDREVELITFPAEDHGISGSWSNRILHRRMMLEFFDRILKNQPEAWESRWTLD